MEIWREQFHSLFSALQEVRVELEAVGDGKEAPGTATVTFGPEVETPEPEVEVRKLKYVATTTRSEQDTEAPAPPPVIPEGAYHAMAYSHGQVC